MYFWCIEMIGIELFRLALQLESFDLTSLIWLLFWLLFFIMPFSTYIQARNLRAARLGMLRALERKYGMRFITMIHRQERVGFLGIPIYRYIDIEDSEEVLRAIRTTPRDKPIALILHTPYGWMSPPCSAPSIHR